MVEEHDGTRLAALLERAGINMSELGRRTDASPQAVKKWVVTGQFARDQIVPICKALRCSADELLGLAPIGDRQSQLARPDEKKLATALAITSDAFDATDTEPVSSHAEAQIVASVYDMLDRAESLQAAKILAEKLIDRMGSDHLKN